MHNRSKIHLIVTKFGWLAILVFSFMVAQAQKSELTWTAREDLNILLPKSVRVFEANGRLADGAPVRAMYATIDLRDKNLKLRAIGSNALRETTQATYERHNAILAINGGYFSAVKSESVLVSDGEIIAPGPSNFTRGAFGLVNRKPQIAWPYIDSTSTIYQLSDPVDLAKLKSSDVSRKAEPWHPALVVGAGPVLMKSGKIRDTSKEEGFGASHLIRHPRTAIGYRDENTIVMMVVDGRQQASAGVTITELAKLMADVGCYEAVNLDGGGSSAMIAADEIVNVPVDLPNGNRHSLRKNASALVLTEEISTIDQEIILIDTDSEQYQESGIWKNSNNLNHYGTTSSREAQTNSLNRASFQFKNIKPGTYQLSAWWTINETNTARATYVLHRRKKTDSLQVDQTSYTSNGRWNVLGNFHLMEGDYLELVAPNEDRKIIVDAVRLVRTDEVSFDPLRGDLRVAIVSDLNSGLGSATYEWQVDSIMKRIPRIWKPDFVLCGGDMVAGMGVSDTATVSKMWKGFTQHIFSPLRQKKIPFAFTIGNHDGLVSHPTERKAIENYWRAPKNETGLSFVDRTHFPSYYSFKSGDAFFVSWDASSSEITNENLAWLHAQFISDDAKKAKARFVVGHLPIYSVAQERDSKGNVLHKGDSLRKLLETYDVKAYISGHQHAYFPGKRGKLQLLNLGAAGSGPRRWLSTDKDPVNTITVMDVFYDRDTIVYSTYDIKHREPKQMTPFDLHELPAAIVGVNGIVIRNDIRIAPSAKGKLINRNKFQTHGMVTASIEDGKVILEGNLVDIGKVEKSNAITVFMGKHTEVGARIASVPLKNTKASGFKISFELPDGLVEALSVGSCFVVIKTNKFPNGELRAQLYPLDNHPPVGSKITSHNSNNVYGIRNSAGLYRFTWSKSRDEDGHDVTYRYRLAEDSVFNKIILEKETKRENYFKIAEERLFKILGNSTPGKPKTFYHQVIATDGSASTFGDTVKLTLTKSNEPLRDFVELDPPQFAFDGKIENTPGQGAGALWDHFGKLWLADYGGSLYAKLPSGEDALFSPLRSVTVNNKIYNLKPINGIGLDLDGNILVASNRVLLKIHSQTGQGIAAWEAPEGKRAITSPRMNTKGEIYAMSLFAEDPNYVLRESKDVPGTFDLIRTINLPQRILSRTFDMSDDGRQLFFPDPGSAIIQTYTSSDGIIYKRGLDITSTAAGCNAIVSSNGKLFAAVRPSGVSGATLHFRDEKKNVMWTLPLPELEGAEARGMALSPDHETIIICVYDSGGGFYRYRTSR